MFIIALNDIHKGNVDNAGGKGANLGELVQSGLPVPPGFVIASESYCRFVEFNQLRESILALAAQPVASDPAAHEGVSAQIHDLFVTGAMPGDLAAAICNAYGELTNGSTLGAAVAVRSSATAEDRPQASFAGQQETFLNVRGEEALLEAIKKCWASLWTARALAYRARMGIDPSAVAMAVVVQAMVPAQVSGVLFTANPTTGARDELVVNASFGLGEAIVSGAVTPDTYVLARAGLTPIETRLGTKEKMIVPANGEGTTTRAIAGTRRHQPALSDPLLSELAALGVRVEEHFCGVPQDIEWAVAEGRIWLLQARPITNLPPAPLRDVRWEPPIPDTVWMRRQVVEHMPEPLSPLFADLYLDKGLKRSVAEMMNFMSDLGDLCEVSRIIEESLPGPFAVTVNGYAYSIASFKFRWSLVPPILRIYVFVLPKMIQELQPYWRKKALPAYFAVIENWKNIDPTEASDAMLLRGLRELAEAEAIYWFAAAIPLGLARVTDALLDRFLKSTADGKSVNGTGPLSNSGPYLRGFPSKALEAQAQLEAIARAIHASADLRKRVIATPAPHLLDLLAEHPDGQPVLDRLRAYLDEYGHQIYNLDFVAPTQADDPLPVLLGLKAAVEHPERDARAHQRELAQQRDMLVKRTERSLSPLQRQIFRLLLRWAQRYTPYREEALFYLGAAWPTLRRLALELGRRLAEAGSLDAPDDVFFLTSAELVSASTARAEGVSRPGLARLARERRELREARKRLDPPVSVPPNATLQFGPFRLTAFEPQPSQTGEGATLNGFAVSPGRVTAKASVIRSPADFAQMAPDTILVCPTTTPAWTPLFSQAKGLVTDIGGALAHGSIVAREYGIPAVMGTGVATQRIRSGQRIEVDGDAGTVTLLDEVETETDGTPEVQPAESGVPARSSKKKLLALAVVAIGLAVWWQKRRRTV